MAAAAAASFAAVVSGLGDVGARGPTRAAAVTVGDVAEQPGTAVPFVRTVVRMIAQNRYAEAWPLLHPDQRRTVGRAEYVACERRSPIPGRVISVRAGAERSAPVSVAPQTSVPARAVSVRVVLLDLATLEETNVRDTVHAVRVDGRWTWVLPPERLAGYRAGACPDAPPSLPGQT